LLVKKYSCGNKVPELAHWAKLSGRNAWSISGKEPEEAKQTRMFNASVSITPIKLSLLSDGAFFNLNIIGRTVLGPFIGTAFQNTRVSRPVVKVSFRGLLFLNAIPPHRIFVTPFFLAVRMDISLGWRLDSSDKDKYGNNRFHGIPL